MRLPDPVRSRALLLGTSRYADPGLPELAMVRNNIDDLAAVLTSPQGTGLRPEACATMPDEPNPAAIGSRLAGVAAQAEDLLLVYYAGHGLVGQDGQLYLSLPGTRSDRHLVAWTGLSFALLRSSLATARAANRLLILDCCFSGLAIDIMSDTASTVAGQIEVSGTCTLTSSPANRPARAPVGARHTAYTGELIHALRHGCDDGGEFLTLQTLHEHLARTLPAKGFPAPEQRNTRTISRLALARNHRHSPPGPDVLTEEGKRLEGLGDAQGALHRYHEAAVAGHLDAMIDLVRLLEKSGQRSQASLWLNRAAEAGNVVAMNELGILKWRIGDLMQAEQWLRTAAEAGLAEAANNLKALHEQQNQA